MVEAMKKVADMDVELTVEERNLLSVGYKNVIGSRRASWRILSSIEQKEESRGNDLNAKRIREYRQKIESELTTICSDIMTVIDDHLIPSCGGSGESTVFYYKMKGDYYRYLAEFKSGNDKKEVADLSMKAYEELSLGQILRQKLSGGRKVTCRLLGVILEESTPKELQNQATVRSSVFEVLLEITKYCDLYLMERVLDDESQFWNQYLSSRVRPSTKLVLAKHILCLDTNTLGFGLKNNFSRSVINYARGTKHVLPTYGYARMYSWVSLDSFLKYITIQSLTEKGLEKLGPHVATMAQVEGLDAHKRAVSLRLQHIKVKKQVV